MSSAAVAAIDKVLPQTQCGLCGYPGCKPYAQAIAEHREAINRCPPGGVETLLALAELTQCDPTPYVVEMRKKAIPPRLAVVKEGECIGCTKCIQACPVDAIVGAAKQMHTVIADVCTGCGLCLPPCPVDCIDLLMIDPVPDKLKYHKAATARARFMARNARLVRTTLPSEPPLFNKIMAPSQLAETLSSQAPISADEIKQAIARVMAKKRQSHQN